MKVLILGGYGAFGARLARLLCRDGHAVTIAGRSSSAARGLADELGCDAIAMDRAGDVSAITGHDVLVDAAGPFHSYGQDRYRLPHACIAAGVHYLDLSDNADFCAGISELNAAARDAGLCVLSGLSSVPALSSAAVEALADGAPIRSIEAAILPGNRAPRGRSVMQSILAQAGQPMPVWRGGRWQRMRGWSAPKTYELPGGLRRQAWQIEVPDNRLFPAKYGAESVQFRAGLELGLMRYGLAGFAAVQRVLNLPVSGPLVGLFKLGADLLSPFGTGRGGMVVRVVLGSGKAAVQREWRLLAQDGDGPFIPAIAVRALLRRGALPIGAAPALGVITLAEAEAAMSDLSVMTETVDQPAAPAFARVLGDAFADLPPQIARTHLTADQSRWQGRAKVSRGAGLWSRLIAALFRFPPATQDTPVVVTKTVTPKGETWQRQFGARRFRSFLAATPQGMTERFGPFTFLLGLHVRDGALHYPVRAARIGRLRLPRWILPGVTAREYVEAGRFCFDVALRAPLTGQPIVRYQGWLEQAPPGDPGDASASP